MIKNIAILGFGKLGQALASVLVDPWRYENHNPEYNIFAWDVVKEQLAALDEKFPNKIKPCETIPDAVNNADLIIISTPSFAVRETAQKIKNHVKPGAIIICGSKGGEAVEENGKLRLNTMYDVLEQELPNNKKAILSGPNLAAEMVLRQPTETVIAAEEKYKGILDELCRIFAVKRFKAIPSFDVFGIELCAFFKHLPVIASGIVEELSELELGEPGHSYNAQGAVIARAIDEIKQLAAKIMEQRHENATFDSVAWIGDIICSASPTGRNYQFGRKLAQGKTAEQAVKEIGQTVEGPRNIEIAYKLMKQYNLSLPLITTIYEIIFKNKPAKELDF
jgi:glycerol-3-phosphate dehydrogenase (NAD(P)+)